jgi:HlyD family secretion protein
MPDPTPNVPPDGGLPKQVVAHDLAEPPKARYGWLRRLRWLPLIPLLVMTGGVIGVYFQPPGLQKVMGLLHLAPGEGTRTPFAVPVAPPAGSAVAGANTGAAARVIVGLGKLVPDGDVRVIAPPFGASDARIAELRVKEGDRVAAGDLLAVLDNEGQFRAAIYTAEAAVAVRAAALEQSRASTLTARGEARAALASAVTASENAKRELERAEPLRARGFLSDSAFEQRRATADQAMREVERQRAVLARVDGGPIDEQTDVVVARRNLEAAATDLARAKADLEKAYVRAPADGTVLTVHVRAGEKPGSKGILNLGNIDAMTAEVEIYQSQIGAVAPGATVGISADALPQSLTGRVTRVGLEVARQTLTDPSPAANTDARVVKVYVTLDPESLPLARRFTNLQIVARISVDPK